MQRDLPVAPVTRTTGVAAKQSLAGMRGLLLRFKSCPGGSARSGPRVRAEPAAASVL